MPRRPSPTVESSKECLDRPSPSRAAPPSLWGVTEKRAEASVQIGDEHSVTSP